VTKGKLSMKITIDIDCTPEEAREFMGLPNMEDVQKAFFKMMQQQYGSVAKDMNTEDVVSMWTEIGQKNMQAFQNMMAANAEKSNIKD
jgi:hypothetical protein